MDQATVQRTPLYDEHVAAGGKVVDFHGWALPVQYKGILHEHHHTREKVSIFDCSHMGEIQVTGSNAVERYHDLTISDIHKLKCGRGRYGAILNDQGGLADDIISVKLAEDDVVVVSNAAPLEHIAEMIRDGNPGATDISADTAKIDVQGPLSREAMIAAGFEAAAPLKYFGACRSEWHGTPVLLTRMGYTGELGYEIYMPNNIAVAVWRALIAVDEVEPAGLGARDTLRLEVGYPLSGQDFDETRTPLEADQEVFVAWDTPFKGKEALLAQREAGDYQLLTPIKTESRQAPRHGFDLRADHDIVGAVASGSFGPSVGHGIGLAYLDQRFAEPGTRLSAGPKDLEIETTVLPFYTKGTCRK